MKKRTKPKSKLKITVDQEIEDIVKQYFDAVAKFIPRKYFDKNISKIV